MYKNKLYTESEVDEMVRKMFNNAVGSYYEPANEHDTVEDKKVDPFWTEVTRKMNRQVRYRQRRDASLSRDKPPRLPCRPFYNNGDDYDWEDQREYHQPRVTQDQIEPKDDKENEEVCYTCTSHRFCQGPVCESRVLTCDNCASEEGPYRVRYNKERDLLSSALI